MNEEPKGTEDTFNESDYIKERIESTKYEAATQRVGSIAWSFVTIGFGITTIQNIANDSNGWAIMSATATGLAGRHAFEHASKAITYRSHARFYELEQNGNDTLSGRTKVRAKEQGARSLLWATTAGALLIPLAGTLAEGADKLALGVGCVTAFSLYKAFGYAMRSKEQHRTSNFLHAREQENSLTPSPG